MSLDIETKGNDMTDMQHPEKLRALAASPMGIDARGLLLEVARAYGALVARVDIVEATAHYWRKRALSAEALLTTDVRRELVAMAEGPPPPELPPPTAPEEAHHGRAI